MNESPELLKLYQRAFPRGSAQTHDEWLVHCRLWFPRIPALVDILDKQKELNER